MWMIMLKDVQAKNCNLMIGGNVPDLILTYFSVIKSWRKKIFSNNLSCLIDVLDGMVQMYG